MEKRVKPIEVLKNRLYWISDTQPPKNIENSFYFNIDKDLAYDPFHMDFGPLNLGKVYKYAIEVEKLLQSQLYAKKCIYHYTSVATDKIANSIFLLGAFQIIVHRYSPEKAFQPFKEVQIVPFRDAGYGDCTYKCTVLDCLRGLAYAIKLGWFNYNKFNLAEYEHYEKLENGDLNWIIPQKFIAFSAPSHRRKDEYGNRYFIPADYVPIFKKMGVGVVVRLNNKTYEAQDFIKEGIKHYQMLFADGTTPSSEIVERFLEVVENEKTSVAIHCKAGLGRTGTLIGLYAMKHYRFPAADFIGWIRIARPGSILGPQQYFLIEQQSIMREKGKNSLIWKSIKDVVGEKDNFQKIQRNRVHSLNIKNFQMSERERDIMKNGQIGQGESLMERKLKRGVSQKQEEKKDQKKEVPKLTMAAKYMNTLPKK